MRASIPIQLAVAALFLALALANCGGPTCTQQVNTSPGTISAGQVSIATDHSVYAPGDELQATITNHLSTRITVNNYRYTNTCPYFALQMRAGNDWQDMPVCTPAGGDAAPSNDEQLIAAGGSFSSAVGIHADLPVGTYHLWISRYSIGDAQGRAAGVGTAESATFQVCACRVCV
jgi:hypothetical protein